MMEPLLLSKLVAIGGLAMWLSIIVVNNARNFTGGAAAIGLMMSMRPFEDPPVIDTPLLSRRVTSPSWHRAVLAFVLVLEIVVALALWAASFMLFRAISGSVGVPEATNAANFALAGFLALVFCMMWGGAWFVYYVRQEGAQITHFTLLCVGLAAIVVANLPSG
jgi:predicted small integral membrane protein